MPLPGGAERRSHRDITGSRTGAFRGVFVVGSGRGNHYLPALRTEASRFEPNSRERLLAGAMTPSAGTPVHSVSAPWFRDKTLPLFEQLDLLAPATPCSATPIGTPTMRINGADLPVKASMGMLTQPISFLGLPVVTVPVKPVAADWRADYWRAPAGNPLFTGSMAARTSRNTLPTGRSMNRDNIDRPAILNEVTAAFTATSRH